MGLFDNGFVRACKNGFGMDNPDIPFHLYSHVVLPQGSDLDLQKTFLQKETNHDGCRVCASSRGGCPQL